METIGVAYIKTRFDSVPAYHKLIVYMDRNGDMWYARGGPEIGLHD